MPNTSVHYDCMTAVKSGIEALALAGLSEASILVRKVPIDWDFRTGPRLPGVLIAPLGSETVAPNAGTNARDDVGYPVAVAILDADNADATANHERYLAWRQSILRKFRHQPLGAVAGVYTCLVEPDAITVPEAFLKHHFVSAFVLRFISREERP